MKHRPIAISCLLPVCLSFRSADLRDTAAASTNELGLGADCSQLFEKPNLMTQWTLPAINVLQKKVFTKLLDLDSSATRQELIADYVRKSYDEERLSITESAITFRHQVEVWTHHKFDSIDCDVNAAVRLSSSADCEDGGSLKQGHPQFGHSMMNLDANATTWMLTSNAAVTVYEIDKRDPRNRLVRTWHCTSTTDPPYVRFEILFASEEDAADNITTVRQIRTEKRGGEDGEPTDYVEQVSSGRMPDLASQGTTPSGANELILKDDETGHTQKVRVSVDASDRLVVEYESTDNEWQVQFKGYPALMVPPTDIGVFLCTRVRADEEWKAVEAYSVMFAPIINPGDKNTLLASKTRFPRSEWRVVKVDGWVDYVGQFNWFKMVRKLASPYSHGKTTSDPTTSTTISSMSEQKSLAHAQQLWVSCVLLVTISITFVVF